MAELNRFRVVLDKIKKDTKWLAGTLGKNSATVTNDVLIPTSQQELKPFTKVVKLLEVNMRELFVSTNQQKQHELMDTI